MPRFPFNLFTRNTVANTVRRALITKQPKCSFEAKFEKLRQTGSTHKSLSLNRQARSKTKPSTSPFNFVLFLAQHVQCYMAAQGYLCHLPGNLCQVTAQSPPFLTFHVRFCTTGTDSGSTMRVGVKQSVSAGVRGHACSTPGSDKPFLIRASLGGPDSCATASLKNASCKPPLEEERPDICQDAAERTKQRNVGSKKTTLCCLLQAVLFVFVLGHAIPSRQK